MPRVRRRNVYHQLTDFERGRIVGLREGGLSYREIGLRLNRNPATIMRVYQIWNEEGRGTRIRSTGQPRRTTERQNRRLRMLALRDRFSTSRQIGDQWSNEEGRPVSMRTIYRRIRSFGLFSYRPHLVIPLTPEHRRQRLNWCRQRQHWDREWNGGLHRRVAILFGDA